MLYFRFHDHQRVVFFIPAPAFRVFATSIFTRHRLVIFYETPSRKNIFETLRVCFTVYFILQLLVFMAQSSWPFFENHRNFSE